MPATAGTILRREHLVAACLVGTVVVVVGFASGLGLTKPDAGSTPAQQNSATPPTPQAGEPGTQAGGAGDGGAGPVNYVGTPVGLAAAPGAGSPAVTLATIPPQDTPPATTGSTPPPISPVVPPTTTGVPPTCTTGLLTGLLNQVTTAANGLPIVGPLAPQLTGTLLGNCPAQSTTDSSAPSTTPAVPGLPLPGSLGTGP
jgi:hypothetical protein